MQFMMDVRAEASVGRKGRLGVEDVDGDGYMHIGGWRNGRRADARRNASAIIAVMCGILRVGGE